MPSSAVITADIVNSTKLSGTEPRKLMKSLMNLLQPYPHEFFRGDSFQVYVRSSGDALALVLQLRATAMKVAAEGSLPVSDIKASIGIGQVKSPVKTINASGGEAFILSGRNFDEMGTERLAILCNESDAKARLGLGVIARFTDFLFQRLTYKQAAVVAELLQDRTQIDTAKRLKKSQATVHKHMRSAGWPEMEKLIASYKDIVNLIE